MLLCFYNWQLFPIHPPISMTSLLATIMILRLASIMTQIHMKVADVHLVYAACSRVWFRFVFYVNWCFLLFSITTILRPSSFFTGTVRSRRTCQPTPTTDRMILKVVLQHRALKNRKRARRKRTSPKARQLSRCVFVNPALAHAFSVFWISLYIFNYILKSFISCRLLRTWNGGLKVSTSRRKTLKAASSRLVKRKGRRRQLLMPDTHCLRRRYLVRLQGLNSGPACVRASSFSVDLPFLFQQTSLDRLIPEMLRAPEEEAPITSVTSSKVSVFHF